MHVVKASSEDFVELSAEVLQAGGSVRFEARGMSMLPAIHDGDILVVASINRRALPGDILLFKTATGRPVAHRVWVARGIEPNRWIYFIFGDNAVSPDGWVLHSEVLGRVVSYERDGKVRTLTSGVNFFYLLRSLLKNFLHCLKRKLRSILFRFQS